MLRHKNLYDPIKREKDFQLTEFTKYIEMRNQQLDDGVKTDPKIVKQIHDSFYDMHPEIDKATLDKTWAMIEPMAEDNAAFAQFILDYGGAESEFFFPWLTTIVTSPSKALEMSYGAGYDLTGDWVDVISGEDRISRFVHDMPTLVYNRERELYMAELVSTVQDLGTLRRPTKVIDLGAGQMAWARWHGFMPNPKRQSIIAYDKDTDIRLENLFPVMPGTLGIDYRHGDIREAFKSADTKEADLVMLAGVASYIPTDMFVSAIVMPMYGFLKKGGVFFFDLQLDCPQYEWTVKLFGWPEMNLAKNPAVAIAEMERVRHDLWEKGLEFGAEYKLDTSNEVSSAVMVTLTKI